MVTSGDLQAADNLGPRPQVPSWLTQAVLILRKDVSIELRSGEVTLTTAFFSVLVVVMSSLAFFVGPTMRSQVAAGVIWIAVAFSTVLALGRSWQRERDDGALDGLLVAPLSRSALFAGKALGLTAFLLVITLIVIPLTALFFSISLIPITSGLALIVLLTLPGVASTATLFGAMTARTRARDLVLAVVLFPLLAPTLITAVVATRELLSGTGVADMGDYFKLLGVFTLTFVSGGLGLFGTLLDS